MRSRQADQEEGSGSNSISRTMKGRREVEGYSLGPPVVGERLGDWESTTGMCRHR